MGRRRTIWTVLAAMAAASALSASVISRPAGEFRQLYALHPNARVTVENLYGNVSITAWDRNAVLVEAVKHASDPRRLDDARIVVEPSPDSLSIRTQYAGSDAEHPTSVEYRITVPRRIHLEKVALTNGRLSLDGLAGPVKASAVNGDIRALKLAGEADLSTVNGRVEANFNRTNAANSISLSSINGAINLTLPSFSGVSLEARNLSGGIASEIGHASRSDNGHRLVVKGIGPHIRVHNVNGGISIHAAERPCT
ncbi:MAG TPA: hypothetical protein VMB03_06225 [Bryobacteraceae bacterium]|nr:hypothetical protein [Bryobacteraceae bacterium]